MSTSLHLISNKIPGHGPSETGNLPCSGVYGRAMGMAARPPGVNKTLLLAKGVSLKCSSGKMSFLCKASSNNQRRNPRQNRQGYSQNKNRQNDERDYPEHLEDTDYLSSKNGPLLSFVNSNKNQATAGPGPREREIVELFRKVQAQLRERASGKEEKKFEVSKGGQNKGNETVDSLLNLLRKHSVEQGKKKVNGGSATGVEVNFDQHGQVGTFDEDNSRSSFNPSSVRDEPQEDNNIAPLNRPPSNFRRRSPVPRVRYEPVISSKETVSSVSSFDPVEKSRKTEAEFDEEPEILLEPEIEAELEHDSFAERDVVTETLEVDDEEEDNDVHEDEDDEEDEKKPASEHKNLDAMKMQELRALAKARGIKRYSKMKKSELIGLLSEDAF